MALSGLAVTSVILLVGNTLGSRIEHSQSSIIGHPSGTEIDISVSKLLGFETFANFVRVSVSVSENLVSEKSPGFGFGLETFANFWRVSVSVSENLVLKKKYRFRFRKIWSRKKSFGLCC